MKALEFEKAFTYPFHRPKGLLNILWVFLPIFGWFALGGYGVRLIQEFSEGKFKQLPLFNFRGDLGLGFWIFLKSIPFLVVYLGLVLLLTEINPWLRLVALPFEIFAIPLLFVHFFNKETASSLFEFGILRSVLDNFWDYIMVLLKSLSLGLIFLFMMLVLVGIPAGSFTKNMFLADFYRRNVK